MKHYIIFLLLLILPLTAFSQGSINLTTTNQNPDLWETFEVEVQLEFDSLTPISDITIPGIEQFDVFSTMQQESTQILWDQVQKTTSIFLQLTPKTLGNYTIWPVSGSFSGELMTSNTLVISVWETQVVPSVTPGLEQEIIAETDDGELEWLREPDMTHIYVVMFLVIFGIIFFYILQKFLSGNQQGIVEIIPEKIIEEIPYKQQIEQLSKDSQNYNKSEFYERLHGVVRQYLSKTLSIKNVDTLTLAEIKPYLKNNTELLNTFSKSYQTEFNEQEDTDWERQQIISEYIKIL